MVVALRFGNLIRFRRFGFSLQYLKKFLVRSQGRTGTGISVLDGSSLENLSSQEIEKALLRNESNREVIESLAVSLRDRSEHAYNDVFIELDQIDLKIENSDPGDEIIDFASLTQDV